jgi:hypothetical protein
LCDIEPPKNALRRSNENLFLRHQQRGVVVMPPFLCSHLIRGNNLDVWTSRAIGMPCVDAGRHRANARWLR